MEGKSVESGSAEEKPTPSVAKLAGIFGDQVNSTKKETPPHKPTRRKPPCSLPLHKAEVTHNDDEKGSSHGPQLPKSKVKSSPLIEKLQANLAFAPASLFPGGPPKSPGLKTMASPFSSPPSTPSSPGVHSHSSESDEPPVSFEQAPEGAHLQSYTKVRTRGSIKRRPPSRVFRKSQSDIGYEDDQGHSTPPNENGNKAEDGDDVFDSRAKQKTQETEPEAGTHRAQSSADEKSSESTKSDPQPHKPEEQKGNVRGTPNKDSTEVNVGGKDLEQREEKDKEKGPVATSKMGTQVATHEQNSTIKIEITDAPQSAEPEKDADTEQSKSGGEEKPEAEK
ncbi:capZ-interacting protein isoform X2 [Ascaphus truei]|uniref:capZ-interacting protein isoform X2 n=1 Tax=Ascaphus truei TaxID=8439 RepID=UPI003F59F61A